MGPWCEKVQSEQLDQFEQKLFEVTDDINATICCAKNMIQIDCFACLQTCQKMLKQNVQQS